MKATIRMSKPQVFKARTKHELMDLIMGYGRFHYSYGSVNGGKVQFKVLNDSRGTIRLYNAVKFRRKASPNKKKVLREPHWIAYVYTMSKETLYSFNRGSVIQGHRNFELNIIL